MKCSSTHMPSKSLADVTGRQTIVGRDSKPEDGALPWVLMSEKLPPLRRHLWLYFRSGGYAHGMCLRKDGGVLVNGTTYPLSNFSHYVVGVSPKRGK